MEKIKEIVEVENFELKDHWHALDGFKVITDKQEILLLIDNHQSCCESSGYFMCNDDFYDFIGATLLDIMIVDKALKAEKVPEVYDGDCVFVNLETDRGTLQFVAYNSHNGYYGHAARIVSKQLTHEVSL